LTEDLCFAPAAELAARIRRRELSPVEVVEAFLERIEARNGEINAYATVIGEQAREAERAVGSGRALGPLHGVPVSIKDLYDYKAGVRNTFGCNPEFGHKATTDDFLFGPTSTPFAPGKNAGGSSGAASPTTRCSPRAPPSSGPPLRLKLASAPP
jgi:aspartyl-tRNA(Asn)/glutamyl-tRNA(Gln) amidotransferase subunit A